MPASAGIQLLDVTSSQVTVFIPLVVQVLQGISVATVASAATWLYGLGTLVPVALTMLALRLLWLHRQRSISYSAQGTPQPGQVASQE